MPELDDTAGELARISDAPPELSRRLGDARPPVIVFTLLSAIGVALLSPVLAAFPDGYSPTDRVESGLQLIGGLALAGAGVAFAVTITRLTRVAQSIAGGDYGAVARTGATVFAAVDGCAAAALTTTGVADLFGEPAGSEVLPEIGYVLLTVPGMVAAAVAVFGTAFAVWRAGRMATPVAISGFVVAFLLLGGVFVVPLVLLPLWLLAAAFVVRR